MGEMERLGWVGRDYFRACRLSALVVGIVS